MKQLGLAKQRHSICIERWRGPLVISESMDKSVIVVAGPTGRLGRRIISTLAERGANVRAIVRHGTEPDKVDEVRKLGATVAAVDFTDSVWLADACAGATCVVSAVAGLRDVIVDAQTVLLVASEITGDEFKLLRPGGLGAFSMIIRIMRSLMPAKDDLYPPWQGMQYLRDMLSGDAKLTPLDNRRYSEIRWTSVKEVLAEHLALAKKV